MRCLILLASMLLLATAATGAELQVIDHSPLAGMTAVQRSATISITFDSAVTATAAMEAPVRVFSSQGALIPCTTDIDGPTSVTLTPVDPLPPGMPITVHIPAGLVGEGGEVLPQSYQWSFWTGSTQTGLHFQTQLVHAGHQPFALAAGDYDESGSLDLVIVEGGALDEVVLLSNDGDANFTETLRVPIANSPVYAVSADFDLDGHLDLAVGHWSTQVVSILLGDGTGGFADPVVYPLGASSHKLAAGDLDGDGYPELVSANRLEGNLSVLWNTGTGSFLVDSPETLGSGTRDVSLGDWDKDGSLDILVAAYHIGYGIHLNDGVGGFSWFANTQPSLPYPSMGSAHVTAFLPSVIWADNIQLGMTEGSPSYFTAYLPTRFDFGTQLEVAELADYLFVTDFDGDGELDLVFVDYTKGRFMIGRDCLSSSWEPGFLRFMQDLHAPPQAGLGDIRNPVAADFDGDGDNDFVTAYRAGGEVHLWRNGSPEEAPSPVWHRMEVQPPAGHYAERQSRIEMDDDGTIHCLYRTDGPYSGPDTGEYLIHSVFRNGVWTHTDLGFLRNNGPNFWMRLDPDGTLHVAWLGSWFASVAWYATWEDGVWTREQLPISGPMTMVPSAGHPPLIFMARGDSVFSMERVDDQWIVDPVYGGFPGGSFEVQLAADRLEDGTPVLAIAYMYGFNLPFAGDFLKVGSPQDGAWSFEIVDRALYSLYGLRVDGTQEPIVAYTRLAMGLSESYHSRIARFNGSQWTTEYAERWINGGRPGLPSAFGVDPMGRPWVVGYEDIFVRGDDHWDHRPLEGEHRFGGISFDVDGHPWISNTEDWKLAIYTTSSRDIMTAVDPGGNAPAPRSFALGDAIPNPFNPSTTITYTVPQSGLVELEIYDLAGRHVRTLVRAQVNTGNHEATWNGKDDLGAQVASGVYLYQLRSGEFVETKRMVLLK